MDSVANRERHKFLDRTVVHVDLYLNLIVTQSVFLLSFSIKPVFYHKMPFSD